MVNVRLSELTVLDSNSTLQELHMEWREHIWIDAGRMHGVPCMRGTRVPVYVILDNLAAGETAQTILEQYPTLRPDHIPAAIAYAAELARERVVPIPV
ncbi:MAG TPA: DUF433 domain-containing protein [Gemmatimonadaceae bacterium]|nr:DUF433 domain-containing protein [Gemmatimonadaceae bacterium]